MHQSQLDSLSKLSQKDLFEYYMQLANNHHFENPDKIAEFLYTNIIDIINTTQQILDNPE